MIAAAPVADTLKRVGDAGAIIATESRHGLWAAQTPQVFRAEALRAAHDRDRRRGRGRDRRRDAGRGRRRPGSGRTGAGPNLKVTTAADLAAIEALLGG